MYPITAFHTELAAPYKPDRNEADFVGREPFLLAASQQLGFCSQRSLVPQMQAQKRHYQAGSQRGLINRLQSQDKAGTTADRFPSPPEGGLH